MGQKTWQNCSTLKQKFIQTIKWIISTSSNKPFHLECNNNYLWVCLPADSWDGKRAS